MDTAVKEPCGVPFLVRIRKYVPHALTMAVATIVYLIVISFVAGNAVSAAAELRRANDSPHNEIVLAREPNGNENFYYLKNYAVSGEKGVNAVSDLLMLSPEIDYSGNNIYFSGRLESGTCAVSANVASRYGLHVGDTARIIGTNKTFTVARLLPAQEGIDEDYKHEGLVVLAYDQELLDRNFLYMSFMTNGDGYRSMERLIYVEDMKEASIDDLLLCAAVAVFAIAAAMTVSELFLFRSRRADYRTLTLLGVDASRLYIRIFAESALRYVFPALITAEFFAVRYASYGGAFYIPAMYFAGACAVFSAVYSFIVIRRLYHVRAK